MLTVPKAQSHPIGQIQIWTDCAAWLQGQVYAALVDLMDLKSVAQLAQQLQQIPCIDVLILNAGVMGLPLGYTKYGFEKHIGTNHFGHFYLFQLLEAKLALQVIFCAHSGPSS